MPCILTKNSDLDRGSLFGTIKDARIHLQAVSTPKERRQVPISVCYILDASLLFRKSTSFTVLMLSSTPVKWEKKVII